MISGYNLIGFTESRKGSASMKAFSPVENAFLPGDFTVATEEEVNSAVSRAVSAFSIYKNLSGEAKALFLEAIGEEIMALGDALIQRAMLESGLPEARLVGERARTVNQLKMFAALLREGSWVEAVIDPALPDRKPLPRADLRKMLVPLGPVLVFGASNFPFAFSTAGGDTASALAAGNPVIVKAHASHLGTNELVAKAVLKAAEKTGMPDGIFSFIIGEGSVTGMQLVKHPDIKAVGFTGSYKAGMAIFRAAGNERETPIPVYAEMSSINPVLLLPSRLKKDPEAAAAQLAGSITLGVGQFCTNPGLLFAINDEATGKFTSELARLLTGTPAATMLNTNICRSYYQGRQSLIQQDGVMVLAEGPDTSAECKGSAALIAVSAGDFIANENLKEEVFGPFSVVVLCRDKAEMLKAVHSLHGQLTGTVIGDKEDIEAFADCVDTLKSKVGRILYNGVPTGVEVCHAMVHGGPFPATTDARSTSVGADAIKRFVRPMCWQDCPADFLPAELKDENPLQIMRKVDGAYKR